MSEQRFTRERTLIEIGKLVGDATDANSALTVGSIIAIQLLQFGDLTEEERTHLDNLRAAFDHAAKGVRHAARRARRLDGSQSKEMQPFNPETEPRYPTDL